MGRGDGQLRLAYFLRTFHTHGAGLRHLTFEIENPAEDLQRISDIILQRDSKKVMEGLTSLRIHGVLVTFWANLYSNAIRVDKLDIRNSTLPFFHLHFLPLRHISLYYLRTSLAQVWDFVLEFHSTLESLSLELCDPTYSNFLPVQYTFDKLTHIYIYQRHTADVIKPQSLLKTMPFLRYVRYEYVHDWRANHSLPSLMISDLPVTVTRLDTRCWVDDGLSSVENLVEALSRQVPSLQCSLRAYIYTEGVLPEKIVELTSAALSRGVELEILGEEDFDLLPSLFDVWRAVRRDRKSVV